VRQRWFSRRAVLLSTATFIAVPACLLAGWWQATRALDGNPLSYLYSVEWPAFALIAVYFWWILIHTDYEKAGAKGLQAQGEPTPVKPRAADEDPELAAYNDRLAQLAQEGPSTWRRPDAPVARRTQ
jgi:hypothetical protein